MKGQYRGAIVFAAGTAVALFVIYELRHVLLLVYVSVLFAAVLSPGVERVRRVRVAGWQAGQGAALLAIMGLGMAILAMLLLFALPPVFRDAEALAAELPRRLGQVVEQARRLPLNGAFDESQLQHYAGGLASGLFGLFKGVASWFVVVASWLILTVYFVVDGRRAFDWSLSFFPLRKRERLAAALLRAQDRMRNWLLGQGVLMLILGTYSLVVFTVLEVKYALALAVFAGLANFIPILGPIVTVILAGLVAMVDSTGKMLGVLAAFLAYQQVENAYLTPRVMQSAAKLRPLAVVVAAALGGTLGGVPGALVAVPSAVVAAVLLEEYAVQHEEGVPAEAPPRIHAEAS